MNLQQELESICRQVDGCRVAVIMNLDGLVVLRHVERKSDLDEEVLLIEMSSVVRQATQAIANVEGGALNELTVAFDKSTIVIRVLKDDHYFALLLDPPAIAGKGRYVLRSHSQAFIQELF